MAEVRPIDANALYDQMTKGTKKYLVVEPGTKRIIEYGYHADDVLASIDQAPKLDYAPVRHGYWIHCAGKSTLWYCSECGGKILYNPTRRTYNIKKLPVDEVNRFCRSCGAKMDGGNTDA